MKTRNTKIFLTKSKEHVLILLCFALLITSEISAANTSPRRSILNPLSTKRNAARSRDSLQSISLIETVLTQKNICPYIHYILNERLERVLSGERKKSFSKYHKSSRLKIVSTHGRNEADEVDATQGPSMSCYGSSIDKNSRGRNSAVFPQDQSSLDLELPHALYELAAPDIAKRIKSEAREDHELDSLEILYAPKLILRAIQLGINFAPVSLTSGIAAFSKSFRDNYWYGMLGTCLARSGPAFIKWGQWASTRSDMFPDKFCEALSQLHADAPAHSWKITQTTVEEALCIPTGSLYDIFSSFDPEPVASGSIAQIHRATIKPKGYDACNPEEEGSLVAVKVRHPNVARLMDMDFRLMSMLAATIDLFPALRWLRLKSSIEQFSCTMAGQAHLNVEAHHLEVLNHNFRDWQYVDFPQPIFACSKVIIETFEEGKICSTVIDQYERLASDVGLTAGDVMPVPLANFVVTTGVALYLKMLIIDNLMHADLHPGNIMVLAALFDKEDAISAALNPTDDLSKKHRMRMAKAEMTKGFYGHITMVDAGMVAQLQDEESNNFIGLLSSMGAGDGRSAAEYVLNFSDEKEYLTQDEEEAFIEDMVSYFDHSCRGYSTNVDVGEVLRGVLGLIKTHHIRVDANYATLVVNALCIEGLAKRVCPSYNVLDAAKPLLSSYRALPVFKSKSRVLKKFVLNYLTPVLYMQKDRFDRKFFKKLTEKRRPRSFVRNVSRKISKSVIAAASAGVMMQILQSDEALPLMQLCAKNQQE